MIYNYHTHTTRCRHAVDSDEEYVQRAIESGIKYLGFSDHVPFVFPDGHESFYHMEISSGEEYVRTIRRLAERYSDKIHISVGFEMEYYPSFFNDMMNVVRGLDVDYLILGQHFIGDEWPNGIGSRGYTEDTRLLSEYVDNVVLAIKSGVFSYVAHPDIVNFGGSEDDYVREMTRLCLAAKENDVPLEINLHGLANKRHYPTERFWKIAGEVGAPVTFGYDVHDSSALLNHAVVKDASRFIKDFGLNYIGMPRLRAIK